MNKLDIKYISSQSKELIQLSPFFIFSDPIEFQGYSFRCLYLFMESLKIEQEKKRKSFLEHFSSVENIRAFYSSKEYDLKFNKSKVESILINNTKVDLTSPQFKNMMLNLIRTISGQNIAYKYSLLSSKKLNLEFSELNSIAKNFLITSKEFSSLIKSA